MYNSLGLKFVAIISVLLFSIFFFSGTLEIVIIIVIPLVLWGLISFYLTKPLLEIIKKMEDVKNGNMLSEVSVNTSDEVGRLAGSFNSMLNKLRITQNGLNKRIEELSVVNKISKAMSSTFNLDELLKLIIMHSRDTIKAEKVSLMLIDYDTNELVIKMAIGINEIVMKRRMKIGEGISGWVAKHGKPLLIQDIEKDVRFKKRKSSKKYANKSLLSVPLISKGKVIGVLNVNNKKNNEVFTESDLNLLTILASQASTAIENSSLLQESMAKKNIDQQMEIAHEIQSQLLPRKVPYIEGLGLGVLYIPARKIGGDYCDIIHNKENNTVTLTVGDVSGKGIPASLLMIMLRSFLKIESKRKESPKELLNELNSLIIADNKAYSDIFITLFYGVIDTKSRIFTYSNAGHDPAYLFHRNSGTFETLKTGDLFLGIFSSAEYHENKVQLEKGDLLILYTDGIIEAFNNCHELFGEERFVRTVFRNIKMRGTEIKDAIYKEILRFTGNKGIQDDDIALLTIDIDYIPVEACSITEACRDSLQGAMVITYMDKWFAKVMENATIRILETMKEKNMIAKDIDNVDLDIENIFFKRVMEDIPEEDFADDIVMKINLRAIFDYIFIIDIINEELGKIVGFDEDTVYEWTVAIKEAVINAISYGTDFDKEEWIGIYYLKEHDKVTISIRDHGKGFDVSKVKDPKDKTVIFSDHGRGILMMKNFMNEVKFNVDPDKGTEVIMVKNIPENKD